VRKILSIYLLTYLCAPLLAQVIAGPTDSICFDYLDADLTTYQISHFEAQWDGQTWISVMPIAVVLADTIPGATTYKLSIPFSNGNHTLSVRACGTGGCSLGSDPFAFMFVVIVPVVPTNIRMIG
jgi:hypothetical protein